MNFKVGEKVVYPNHGIGVIEKISNTEIAGTMNSFYHLRLKPNETQRNESTVMVPIKNAGDVGLRYPIKSAQCDSLLSALAEDFISPPIDWKDRYKEFQDKMKTGDIFQVADVLKNLTYLSMSKPLSFREKRLLEKARHLVISELAIVCRRSNCTVTAQVDEALAMCCSRHSTSVSVTKNGLRPSRAAMVH